MDYHFKAHLDGYLDAIQRAQGRKTLVFAESEADMLATGEPVSAVLHNGYRHPSIPAVPPSRPNCLFPLRPQTRYNVI
jgi:hypothetical protein